MTVVRRGTDALLPTKLVDGLPAGMRMVSSPLPAVVAVSRELGSDLLRVCDYEGLVEAIRELIQMETVDEDTRRAVYQRYDGGHLVDEWIAHVEDDMSSSGEAIHATTTTAKRPVQSRSLVTKPDVAPRATERRRVAAEGADRAVLNEPRRRWRAGS